MASALMKRPPGPRRKACRKGGDVPWWSRLRSKRSLAARRARRAASWWPAASARPRSTTPRRALATPSFSQARRPRPARWRHVAHLPVGVPDVLQERCDGDPARRAQADGPGRGRCQTQAPQVRRSSGSGSGADGCTSRHAPVRSQESGVCGCSLHLTLVFILHPGLKAL